MTGGTAVVRLGEDGAAPDRDHALTRPSLGDRVLVMDEGQIIEQGRPATIFTNPSEPRTRQFLRKILEKV